MDYRWVFESIWNCLEKSRFFGVHMSLLSSSKFWVSTFSSAMLSSPEFSYRPWGKTIHLCRLYFSPSFSLGLDQGYCCWRVQWVRLELVLTSSWGRAWSTLLCLFLCQDFLQDLRLTMLWIWFLFAGPRQMTFFDCVLSQQFNGLVFIFIF